MKMSGPHISGMSRVWHAETDAIIQLLLSAKKYSETWFFFDRDTFKTS